ncbi:MAG: hypothetical protein HYW22_00700 [Candidatus Aenigmarchaeota archaeon]|nr:hypothetical protein [Candidatus Aenigmarchaeota archaeon]
MVLLTHNLLKSRKGQFFILSAVAVVTILFFVSRWIEPLRVTDTSSVVLSDEAYVFDNINEKTTNAVKGSENCDELDFNVQEYKNFVERYGLDRGYKITLDYSIPSCTATATVIFHLKLHSDKVDAASDFSIVWP